MRALQSRHAKGTPVGGRFATQALCEADVALVLDLGMDRHLDALSGDASPVMWHPGNDHDPATSREVATDETRVRWIHRACGHIVEASARTMAAGPACGECNPPGYRHPWLDVPTDPAECLAAQHPDLAACVDPDLNGGWTPDAIPTNFRGTIVWSMPCGHTYRAKVKGRTTAECAVCDSTTLMPGVNDLHTLHPDLASQALPRLNGGLHPVEVNPHNRLRRLAWQDPACGHTWRDTPYSRVVLGQGCPDCAQRTASTAA